MSKQPANRLGFCWFGNKISKIGLLRNQAARGHCQSRPKVSNGICKVKLLQFENNL